MADSDSSEEEWREGEESEGSLTSCLFCTLMLPSAEETLEHCIHTHDINMEDIKHKLSKN